MGNKTNAKGRVPSGGKSEDDLPGASGKGDQGDRIKRGIVGGDGDLRGYTSKAGEADTSGGPAKIAKTNSSGDTPL